VEIVSRYVVGTKSIAGDQAPPAKDLVDKVDEAAKDPLDEFRAITVVGELEGAKAALERLDGFERKYPVVRLRRDADALRKLYASGADSLSDEERALLVQAPRVEALQRARHAAPLRDERHRERDHHAAEQQRAADEQGRPQLGPARQHDAEHDRQ